VRPVSSYFVCGIPRAGTWLLCGLLASSGVAGDPQEWFWRDTERDFRERWGVSTDADYLARVLETGTTPNGVFGSKLMWGYHGDFLARLRRLAGSERLRDGAIVERFFPAPRYVWIRRDDVVAQAVSWAKAIQSGYWHVWDERRDVELRLDLEQVDALVREVREHDLAWRRWFGANGVEPLVVRYEELAAEQQAVTRRVLDFLGVAAPPGTVFASPTRPTADAVDREWIARYSARPRP
jgi:trehalose 2-sulfotransferase